MASNRQVVRAAWVALALAAGIGVVLTLRVVGSSGDAEPAPVEPAPLRYAEEYPPIAYATTRPAGAVAALERRLADGTLELAGAERTDLLRVLAALDIDPASQTLVFSKTSQSVRDISPATPRALYFNDTDYVAYVPGRPLEIASMDPDLGAVFYTLDASAEAGTGVERHTHRCLRCHDSYSLSGGGVPRLMIGSGYTNTAGQLVSHEGWILTSERTPLASRWGGWYVTGLHGDQVHLGNIAVPSVEALQNLEALRNGNLEDLDGLVDTSAYATGTSDIVALMVLAHQINVQNLITRVHYDIETELARRAREAGDAAAQRPIEAFVAEAAEPLVRALLFDGEATLTAPIEGTSGFAARFEARGPVDAQGRSLRELDLVERMFEYPVSYVIYSDGFAALPAPAKAYVYARLAELLSGPLPDEPIGHLATADRAALLEMLRATLPGFAASSPP